MTKKRLNKNTPTNKKTTDNQWFKKTREKNSSKTSTKQLI